MGENFYYMSIGYPIGLCQLDNWERVFNVELNGNFIGLSLDAYNLWKFCFFDTKSLETIKESFDFNVDKVIEDLESNKLLLRLDFNDVDSTFNKIKILTTSKNGFGVGLNTDDKFEILNQGKPFHLNADQFRFWSECDNRRMNKLIFEKLYKNIDDKKVKIYIINIVLTLKTLDLIRLNKRERI